MDKEWYKSTVRPILLTLSCSIAIIVANDLNLEEVDGFSVYRGFGYLSLFDGLFSAFPGGRPEAEPGNHHTSPGGARGRGIHATDQRSAEALPFFG